VAHFSGDADQQGFARAQFPHSQADGKQQANGQQPKGQTSFGGVILGLMDFVSHRVPFAVKTTAK
jgi:hypothetical protein